MPFWCGLLTPKSLFQKWIIHTMPVLSELPSISNPQRRRINFSKWRDPNNQKYFSGPNPLENLHWSSFNNLYTGWPLSSTKIWLEFNSCVVFSKISMQWYCVSSVCTGASIKGRIAEMWGFLVWWLLWECYQAHAVQILVILVVLTMLIRLIFCFNNCCLEWSEMV